MERWKLAGQITLGVALGVYLWQFPLNPLPGASTTLPFVKGFLVVPATIGMAWLYVPFVTFVMTACSNAVMTSAVPQWNSCAICGFAKFCTPCSQP